MRCRYCDERTRQKDFNELCLLDGWLTAMRTVRCVDARMCASRDVKVGEKLFGGDDGGGRANIDKTPKNTNPADVKYIIML